MDKLSGMWDELQRSGSLPEKDKSSLVMNCESELQELIRQIDIMSNTEKVEWEKEKQALNTKIAIREDECSKQKEWLSLKNTEIGQMKQKLNDMERNQSEIISQYERQLSELKIEVNGMKKEYEKLKKINDKNASKERAQTISTKEETLAEVRRMSSKNEEYKNKIKELELSKKNNMKQIESLESQNNKLKDRLELSEEQNRVYISQLDRRKDFLDSNESKSRTLQQFEKQIVEYREKISVQEKTISQQQLAMDNYVTNHHSMAQTHISMEHAIKQMEKKIESLENELQQKEDLLQNTNLNDAESNHQNSSTVLDNIKQTEESLRKEIKYLYEQLSHYQEQCRNLSKDLHTKLQDKFVANEEKHEVHSKEYESEIEKLTNDLHQRNLTVSAMYEQFQSTNKKFKFLEMSYEQKHTDFQVMNAQFEALKLENKHLRHLSIQTTHGLMELQDTESGLCELQNAYISALQSLEQQNDDLKNKITCLHETLVTVENQANDDNIMETMNRDLSSRNENESMMNDLLLKINKYESIIAKLEEEKFHLQKVHEATSDQNKNEAVANQVPRLDLARLDSSGKTYSSGSSLLDDIEIENDDEDVMDDVDIVTAKFLAEQEKRTKELEKKLDMHMANLKVDSIKIHKGSSSDNERKS